MSYVGREFSSARWKVMKEDSGVSNAQAWGCPSAPPIIFKETQAAKLGDAPDASPSSSTIIGLSFVALCFYHFMCYVLCLEHLALYFSRFVFCFVCCSNKLEPSILLCGRETRSA